MQAGAVGSGDAQLAQLNKVGPTERKGMCSTSETWKRECWFASLAAWFTAIPLPHQKKTSCSSAASYCKAARAAGFAFFL